MLDQIKKSGLHNKTKVAQELVRELETYIKSAGMKKQADLRLLLSKRDDDLNDSSDSSSDSSQKSPNKGPLPSFTKDQNFPLPN